MVNTLAHQLVETVTNPNTNGLRAWQDAPNGLEAGDKCAVSNLERLKPKNIGIIRKIANDSCGSAGQLTHPNYFLHCEIYPIFYLIIHK